MIFFTSDLHLGHANAIEFTNRPFANVDEMNAILLQNINDVVGLKDDLWILGDFAFRIGREDVAILRRQIKCKHVHLVRGNHDRDYSHDNIFESVQEYKELKTVYGRFVLFHYPIQEWNAAHYGSVHLHGHIHSTGEYNSKNLQRKNSELFHKDLSSQTDLGLRIYDVGVDANDYKPVSLEQIAEKMNLQKIK